MPIAERGGILDRKLRVVSENTETEEEWLFWAFRAFEATYGYEFSGDNLLIARLSFVLTFENYLMERWHRTPMEKEYDRLLLIITWNLWQMDGLSGRIPFAEEMPPPIRETSLFEDATPLENETLFAAPPSDCKIFDWRRGNSILYRDIATRRGERTMGKKERNIKFDFIIGNPPYQEEAVDNGRQPPVYHKFMDEVYKISDCVELITPARFLFNAGQTPKVWNQKMLQDDHLKVLYYEANAEKVFPGKDIKGGVVITLHQATKEFGKIEVFTKYEDLNHILDKVRKVVKNEQGYLDNIVSSTGLYRFTKKAFDDFPEIKKFSGEGTGNKILSKEIAGLPNLFVDEPDTENSWLCIHGKIDNKRVQKYIKKEYVEDNPYINTYNVLMAKAIGSGHFGETLSKGIIAYKSAIASDTFVSIGKFESKHEADSLCVYLMTKFARTMLGILKVTQDNPPATWKYVPLQDFTEQSDIDWSQSVSDIDRQLYKKYGLAEDEISFIESHVKEMK